MTTPPRGPAGYVYVVAFDNGTVKVGRTVRPADRLSQHRGQARTMGVAVVDTWTSHCMWSVQAAEDRLIDYLARHGQPVGRSREYATGVAFDALRSFAERLPNRRASVTDLPRGRGDSFAENHMAESLRGWHESLPPSARKYWTARTFAILTPDQPEVELPLWDADPVRAARYAQEDIGDIMLAYLTHVEMAADAQGRGDSADWHALRAETDKIHDSLMAALRDYAAELRYLGADTSKMTDNLDKIDAITAECAGRPRVFTDLREDS